jgi:hypothetical protein
MEEENWHPVATMAFVFHAVSLRPPSPPPHMFSMLLGMKDDESSYIY